MENVEQKRKDIAKLVKEKRIKNFQELLEKTDLTKEELHKLFIPEDIIEYNKIKRELRENKKIEIDEQR